jgi:membrane protease YdiL (CAAX protease family)
MEKMKRFATDQPVLFSTLVMLASIGLTEIPLAPLFAPQMGEQAAHYMALIFKQGLVGLALFVIVARFGWMRPAGFTGPGEWKKLWLGWPLVIFCLFNAADFITGDKMIDFTRPAQIILLGLKNLSTGWFEETLGRGVMLTALMQKWGQTRRGIILAVLVSSGLFGIGHIINLITGRFPVTNYLAQMAYGTFFAIIFAACVLRNRAIWPMMLMHAAFNFAGNLQEIAVGGGLQTNVEPISAGNALVTILITLPLGLYGLYLLRNVEPISSEQDQASWATTGPSTAAIS